MNWIPRYPIGLQFMSLCIMPRPTVRMLTVKKIHTDLPPWYTLDSGVKDRNWVRGLKEEQIANDLHRQDLAQLHRLEDETIEQAIINVHHDQWRVWWRSYGLTDNEVEAKMREFAMGWPELLKPRRIPIERLLQL